MADDLSWIAVHPTWYALERDLLAHRFPEFNLSEVELAKGRLAYTGEIVIDRGVERHRKPVMLEYPAGTPYRAPVVVPLIELPSGDQWSVDETRKRFLRMPEGYWRHQMHDGALCLIERDSYAREDPVHGADVLRRAKEVFKAIALGQPFPYRDSEESELEAHFERAGDIVLGEPFYDQTLTGRGKFYAFPHADCLQRSPAYVPQSNPPRLLFVGVNISQLSAAGFDVAWRNADTTALKRAFPWLSSDAFSYEGMSLNKELREAALEGWWYDLPTEPVPVTHGRDLESIFKSIGVTDVGAELQQVLPDLRPGRGVIGFRYPSRHGDEKEWLVLLLNPTEDLEAPETRDAISRDARVVRDVLRAAPVLAFRTHALLRPALEIRNRGQVPTTLGTKTVLILGCGALGGDVAVTLAKAGVRKLMLQDSDAMRSGNAIRHVAPLTASGLRKVDAVRSQIWQHNPFVEVEVVPSDVTRNLREIEQTLATCDLAVSTMADEDVEMLLNEAAVRVERTVIYGRALRAGAGARIFRVRPGQDACKRCLSLYRSDAERAEIAEADGGAPDQKTSDWITLPPTDGEVVSRECGNPVLAGSAADLRIAADLTARAAMDELGAGVTWNTLLWSRDALPEVHPTLAEPYAIVRQTFTPHPACTVCGRPLTKEILITEGAYRDMVRLTEAKPNVETGGILIGYRDVAGSVHVLEVTDAGPNAVERATQFERDCDYCQTRVDDAARRLGARGQYVGEWHSHLEAKPRPSPRDIESLVGIAGAPNYLTDEPVMLIAGLDPTAGRVARVHASCFPIGKRCFERPYRVVATMKKRARRRARRRNW